MFSSISSSPSLHHTNDTSTFFSVAACVCHFIASLRNQTACTKEKDERRFTSRASCPFLPTLPTKSAALRAGKIQSKPFDFSRFALLLKSVACEVAIESRVPISASFLSTISLDEQRNGQSPWRFILAAFLFLAGPAISFSQDTLKIMTWNLLNYVSTDYSRDQYYRTVIRHVKPDVLVVQEMTSQATVDHHYSNVVGTVFPGQFSKSTFNDGPDTDCELYFKTTKLSCLSNTPIHTALRDINEFKLVHTASAETLRVYSVHLKASTGYESDRAAEVDSLRKVTNALPVGKYFMVMGDFNIYRSSEPAYAGLLQNNSTDDGHFVDTIHITGTWNNGAYAQYHTQSTRTRQFGGGATGGMDDRFDLLLFSRAIASGSARVSYAANSMTAIGNDGLHYNDSINRMPNNSAPDSIVTALYFASDHLPVSARFVFPSSPIPIQLASFTAQPVPGVPSSVALYWRTLSETNNFGFEVQRKQAADTTYSDIPGSFIAGHGTTIDPHDYTFTDSAAPVGNLNYRLKQIDLDGTLHFTQAVSITIVSSIAENSQTQFRLFQNYPNPFNPSTTIHYQLSTNSHVTLKVYDLLGRDVAILVDDNKGEGTYEVVIKGAMLASGVYVYRLQAGGLLEARKMIVAR